MCKAPSTPQDIKDHYGSVSICGNNRVVFNVGGNKYRLMGEIQYQADEGTPQADERDVLVAWRKVLPYGQ